MLRITAEFPLSTFWMIISSQDDILTYQSFFVPLLRDLTANEYTLKDSFEFAKVICEQNSDLYMASLDVDWLFTNVPLDETIEICTQGLFENESTVCGLK